jgi:hypothetical protein
VHVKKILVAAVVTTALVLPVGVQTTSAFGSVAADGSSSGATFSSSATKDRPAAERSATTPRPTTATARAKGKGGGRYHVPTGAYFNNPRGGWPARMRIERQVLHAIYATKKGAIIRNPL